LGALFTIDLSGFIIQIIQRFLLGFAGRLLRAFGFIARFGSHIFLTLVSQYVCHRYTEKIQYGANMAIVYPLRRKYGYRADIVPYVIPAPDGRQHLLVGILVLSADSYIRLIARISRDNKVT
jgi:hypothetical protein